MDRYKDTICAISTGLSQGGIGIIRLSGNNALNIAASVFTGADLSLAPSHTINFGYIVDDCGRRIDEVLVSIMKAPKSYTREDVVEINCHGGIVVLNKVLDLLIKKGARPAEPGEFTKRAFLNGRIDLSEAEAVMDIISSKNELFLSGAVRQLSGALSDKIKELRKSILYNTAFLESALDDPEHYELTDYSKGLKKDVSDYLNEIDKLIRSEDTGSLLKNGIKTVILGKPNAGKSSLLNMLSKKERAIVTEIPGTTRDVLNEEINLDGILLNVVDTAGIRKTDDKIEKIGIDKSLKESENADLIILLCDASKEIDENDRIIFKKLKEKKKTIISLLNKTDLTNVTTPENIREYIDIPIIKASVKENKGIDELKEKIISLFFNGKIDVNEEIFITNSRHKYLLQEAKKSLTLLMETIESGMPEDLYSVDLTDAYKSLGEIIGEEIGDDVANEIFSKFCMGK